MREPEVFHPIEPAVATQYPEAESAEDLDTPDVAQRAERRRSFTRELRQRLAKRIDDGKTVSDTDCRNGPKGAAHNRCLTPFFQAELVFESVDLLGEVWLNDERVGDTDNAFRPWSFEVAGRLKPTGNALRVRLRALGPVLDAVGPWRDTERASDARLAHRTCQCLFGWDWAPILPAIGLGQVHLVGWDTVRIDDVHLRTRVNGQVDVFVELVPRPEKAVTIEVAVRGHGAQLTERRSVTAARSIFSFRVPDPHLWWPNGYGEQPLYDLTVRLLDGRRVREHVVPLAVAPDRNQNLADHAVTSLRTGRRSGRPR